VSEDSAGPEKKALRSRDGVRPMEVLVFDVGMNVGMDTAYYLSKGCRVIAVEANPVLCEEARHRFAHALRSGQLVIENVGVADDAGTATFYVNERNSEFSAFDLPVASRGGAYHAIQVPTVRFRDLLAKHGVPHYLKIDIEGYDGRCLEALEPGRLPKYVSIEAHELHYLLKLWCLGYRKFKVIDQMRHNSTLPLFSNENPLSRALKLACWYLDRVKNKWGKGSATPHPRVARSVKIRPATGGRWKTSHTTGCIFVANTAGEAP
jgi:FkbM family methyltransferase